MLQLPLVSDDGLTNVTFMVLQFGISKCCWKWWVFDGFKRSNHWGFGVVFEGPIWSTDRQWLHTLTQQGHAYWVHSWHSCIGYIHLCSHVSKKIHPQLNSDLNWPRPICLNWLIHQFWYPKWDSPKMTQFCWSHSFEIVAPLWLQTSDSSAMVPVWVLSIGSFVETRCAYVYACMYMVVDQNSFIRERPFFANKNVTFAKLSRTPCLSFAEPMLGNHDIQLSRNFRETKCYFCELEKKTLSRGFPT